MKLELGSSENGGVGKGGGDWGARMEGYQTPSRWERDAQLTGHRVNLIPTRVVRSWERLVGAAVRAERERSGEQDGFDSTAESAANQSLAAPTYIDAVMEAAEDLAENDRFQEALIVWESAFELTREMDPSNPRRSVLQFKAGLKRFIVRMRMGDTIDRSKDFDIIKAYYEMFEEKEDSETLDAEEQASREGLGPEGETYDYQAWRRDKVRRFHAISNILNNVVKSLEGKEPEVGSSACDPADTSAFH